MTAQHAKHYEPQGQKPLIQNMVVEADKKRYRVHRWYYEGGHCYEFEFIGSSDESTSEDFVRSPSQVVQAMKDKKLKVIFN